MGTLISFSGLPGVGKTTIGRKLSIATNSVYLRIDEIDAVIWEIEPERDIGTDSYKVAAVLARSNLELGHSVIIDCVNPFEITRSLFSSVAKQTNSRFIGVELFCSDKNIHKFRVENRHQDILSLRKTKWVDVLEREYIFWDSATIRIDTAKISINDAVSSIVSIFRD